MDFISHLASYCDSTRENDADKKKFVSSKNVHIMPS